MFGWMMRRMKAARILPRISDTERLALEAGTVWIDGEFFRGTPDFERMLDLPYASLHDEERAFLDGPVEALLRMIDAHSIAQTRRVPDEVLAFLKREGFFGLIIPKEYGGKDFSTLGVSTVMAKINPICFTVGAFVVIPNSLGAAELLKHYGTEAQKRQYLPKLAAGDEVPCFGLTEPLAGSDAASITADGLVFRDADGSAKIRLNFRKRYITLAPAATLVTLACKLRDPDNLLGKGTEPGISCVMIHQGTPGFTNGDHHDPIGDPFYNGPLTGKDVVVPADNIIGGPSYAGEGWRMLMEQLAGGRVVSLPAGAIGGARLAAGVTGAYSMVRHQFGFPIGRMEGVQDKLARLAALSYLLEGARIYTCSAVDAGEQPPVISAVMKAYSTELSRELVMDAMDVFSGAGIMQGPNNILGRGYSSAPVGITVEGANIMTRTLMIFGQGATRCHPYALNVVNAVEHDDVRAFRRNLLGWIGHFIANCARGTLRYLTRGASAAVPAGPMARHWRRLAWSATRFAVLTDLAMFTIGGKLKVRGALTGRYSDVLAWMILATGALRRFEAEGRPAEDAPLVHYACDYALLQIQRAFEGIYANFDAPVLGALLRSFGLFALRLNPVGRAPADALAPVCAGALQAPGPQWQRLMADVFIAAEDEPGVGRLMKAFRLLDAAQSGLAEIARAQHLRQLGHGRPAEFVDEALQRGIIDTAQAERIRRAEAACRAAIEVDQFRPEQYFRDAKTAVVEPLPLRRAVQG